MKCASDKCKKDFTNGQDVFVSQDNVKADVYLCSEKCCVSWEGEMKQLDLVPKRRTGVYKLHETKRAGCYIAGLATKPTTDGQKTVLTLEIPSRQSLDEVAAFIGEQVTVRVLREDVQIKKEEEKKAKTEKGNVA
jgi:hypothetical protein